MKSTKFIIGTIEVDSSRGNIWINSQGKCILRIQNLNFKKSSEKFDCIDINGKKAYMLQDYLHLNNIDNIENLINQMLMTINSELIGIDDINKEDFLRDLNDNLGLFIEMKEKQKKGLN